MRTRLEQRREEVVRGGVVQAAALRAQARGDNTTRGAAARRQAFGLERAASALVLSRADVVCATCVGAGDELLEGFTFRVACVDEATQCPEPAALIPLSKALTGVLVGDARQLPPTVVSPKAVDAGLRCSLFERLERLGLRPDLLDRQYRMHPALAEFPSAAFYGGRVGSDPTPASRPLPAGLLWPGRPRGPVPLAFVEVDGGEERRAPDGLSIYNAEEARVAVAVVERLLACATAKPTISRDGTMGVTGPGDVGVIAPYAAQVRVLQELWDESRRRRGGDFENEGSSGGGGGGGVSSYLEEEVNDDDDDDSSFKSAELRSAAAAAAAAEARAARELEVHSVDGFQGREKEVIVLCTVRANERGKMGFVADDRRLNVAITRAKRGLVVLGNRATLSSDETWRKWFKWVDKYGLTVRSSEFVGSTASLVVHKDKDNGRRS